MLETTPVTLGGLGVALPDQVVTSAEIAERLGVTEDWIVSRTGIRERRWLRPDENLADLATAAARRALYGAEPDLVLVATTAPQDLIPALGSAVAARVGAPVGFDVNVACTGFLAAIALGAAQIEAGRAERVLVVGAERLSSMLDPQDRGTAALFGDAAGALLLGPEGPRVGPITLRSDDHRDLLFADRDRGIIEMAGADVFKHAVARMADVARMAESAAGVDADLYVFHQANARIVRAVGQRLGLDPERVVDCIATVGNVSAASLPLALAAARDDGRLRPGTRVLLGAFGAGFAWGAGVLEW